MTSEVQLAIYDLSQGMARGLSAQFLGPQHAIDIIPHTGIVVFGQEYFFGGGIQSANPMQFRQSTGMFPINIISLGRTRVTRTEFEQWCTTQMQTGRYNAEAYDLLQRNCNNFSHDAAIQGLQLSQGVPDWILQVPQRFLSSPMGQMVRPMLENMQVAGGVGNAPFANAQVAATLPTPSSSSPPPSQPSASMPATNPWAHIPAKNKQEIQQPTQMTTAPTAKTTTSKLLDTFTKPLISSDTKTASVCVSKLSTMITDEQEKEALSKVGTALTQNTQPQTNDIEITAAVLSRLLSEGTSITFCLLLLRLLVLKTSQNSKAVLDCINWILQQLSGNDENPFLSTSQRAMSWCTVSNWISTKNSMSNDDDGNSNIQSLTDTLVELAIQDLAHDVQPQAEVREMAASFLYNVALLVNSKKVINGENTNQGKEGEEVESSSLSDLIVSMLCSSLENVVEESSATTRLRRLMIAGRIIKPTGNAVNVTAKELAATLGFIEVLDGVSNLPAGDNNNNDNDTAAKCKELAKELKTMLES